MKQLVLGILAHVDAGKTTLSEALLYRTGAIRDLGRVDHKNAHLDTHALERARGITIFSRPARRPRAAPRRLRAVLFCGLKRPHCSHNVQQKSNWLLTACTRYCTIYPLSIQNKAVFRTRYCVFDYEGEEQKDEDHQAKRRRGEL